MIRALNDREIVDKWVIRILVRLAGKISQGLQNDEIQLSERIVQPIPGPSHDPSPALWQAYNERSGKADSTSLCPTTVAFSTSAGVK